MAGELVRRGVTHVVMEASGVYTEPVYYTLCEQDFTEVAVINPAHAKAPSPQPTSATLTSHRSFSTTPSKAGSHSSTRWAA